MNWRERKMIKYNIYYNDGAYYGTMTFKDTSINKIESEITKEIKDNNKNINPMYHITRNNFIEVLEA
jgi:L-fucose mutarotase/ribose pyranase (RbsD/FucU family)